MEFSVTEIELYLRCQRRWKLQAIPPNGLGLSPFRGMPALILGGLIHKSLEAWQRAPSDGNKFIDIAAEQYVELQNQHIQQTGAMPSDEDLAPLLDSIDLGNEMIENYIAYYRTPLPKGYRFVQAEQEVVLEIPNTAHLECDTCHQVSPVIDTHYCGGKVTWQPHKLRCTLDELVVDEHDKLWLLERKTYGNRPRKEVLQRHHQMLAYIWATSMLFGYENVGGVLYDGLWKRSLRKERGKDRSLEDLFYREIFIRERAELDEFEKQTALVVTEMASKVSLEDCVFNRRWEGCYDCAVQSLCDAISLGEDVDNIIAYEYIKRGATSTGSDSWPEDIESV